MRKLRVYERELDVDPDLVCYWQGQLFTGISYDLWQNGNLGSEIEYINGIQEGMARSWYPSGQLQEEESYHQGVPQGIRREWSVSGRLEKEVEFELGVRVRETVWDAEGAVVREYVIDEADISFPFLEMYRALSGKRNLEQ